MELVVAGVKPYDGSYQLDFEQELTTREWGWIKRLAGYLPMAVTDEAFGDPEIACVLTVIAMRRAGRIDAGEVPGVFDRLADAPFGAAITVTDEEQDAGEGDDRPPQAGPNVNAGTSGDASPTSSETPATAPSPTGTPASATSPSAPLTLAT
jgi:hypothetical protein